VPDPVEALKKSNAALSPKDAALVTSTTTSLPATAASRPLPVTVSTPSDKDAATTPWPERRRFSQSRVPMRPLAPATVIFISASSVASSWIPSTMTGKPRAFHRT
jgi:hypothetical protein